MSIVFFLDHDEWHSQKMTKGQGISSPLEKRSWTPWQSEAPPKCFLSWSWWTFPFIWGWWMPKNRHLWKPTRNNVFSNQRRLNFQVYIVETGRLCYVPGGKGEMIISEGEVLCLPSLWAVAWFSWDLRFCKFEILKLPEIRWRWDI